MGGKVSGKVRDKDGKLITGVSASIDVFDKDDMSSRLAHVLSNSSTGGWRASLPTKDSGDKVLAFFWLVGGYGPADDIAGAEFMEVEASTTTTTSSTSSTTSSTTV